METIAINANEAHNDERQDKKKFKVSDTAKAAMAAGIAGVAAGAVGMSMADDSTEDIDDVQISTSEGQHDLQENAVMENEIAEDVVLEVNPDDVMLEEPVAEPSLDVEVQPIDDDDNYHPFAYNDKIDDEIIPEPEPDEVLIAENTYSDVMADDPTVDIVCGQQEEEIIMPEDTACFEDNLYADNGAVYDDTCIQSDLMA